MNEYNSSDALNENEYDNGKLPTGLNVLTILTFIGSGFSLLFSVIGFFSAKTSFDNRDETIEKMNSTAMPSWMKAIMPNMSHFDETITKSFENRIPILMLSFIAIGLCVFGAIQMRKRMKQGFILYTIGELLPILTSAFFIGFFTLSGLAFYFMLFLSLLFIFLYMLQRKYLTK
jgi:hypothetical protein